MIGKRGMKGKHNAWTHQVEVVGWAGVMQELQSIQHSECDGAVLLAQVMKNHDEAVVYKFGCGFMRSHDCKWCCRVLVPKLTTQKNVTCVPVQKRPQYHAHHRCIIQIGSQSHSDHRSGNAGPCKLFTAAAQADKSGCMVGMRTSQIVEWMLQHKVQHKSREDLRRMAIRTKRWCTRKNADVIKEKHNVADCIDAGAQFEQMAINMELTTIAQGPDFSVTDTYKVPGSIVVRNNPTLNVVMFTTLHNMLHLTRAMMSLDAMGMLPMAAIDHTYKV